MNICNEFDNYTRELFEVEPPLCKFGPFLKSFIHGNPGITHSITLHLQMQRNRKGHTWVAKDGKIDDELDCLRTPNKGEKDVNIGNEFDNYMRELFEVEPPLGKSHSLF